MAKPMFRAFGLGLLLSLAACGRDAGPSAPAADRTLNGEDATPSGEGPSGEANAPGPGASPEMRLSYALAKWSSWAPLCEGQPSKADCDDGDMALFNGLLCAAHREGSCASVKSSQGASGQFWRSPRRVGVDKSNSFSRDMALGVLLYLEESEDTVAAKLWLKWIDQNWVCEVGSRAKCKLKSYRLCLDDSDGRCTITPGLWAMMGRVWQKLELPLHTEMSRWLSIGESGFVSEAKTVAPGFALHLAGVSAFLYENLALNLPFETELKSLVRDRQPDNIFFQYLADGVSPTLIEGLLSKCPLEAPELSTQWNWERDTVEKAWEQSMGWDCIFLGTVLMQEP